MKFIKKYIPCKIKRLLIAYLFMFVVIIYFSLKRCSGDYYVFGKALLICTFMLFIVSPFFGLIFTQKSINTCKIHIPYKYIKKIYIDEHIQKVTIICNYIPNLCIKTKKEYKFIFYIDDYKTTLSEIIKLFPANIPIIYD